MTSTVDGLLSRGGLHRDDLVELRGRGDLATCTRCGRSTPIGDHAAVVAEGRSPTCGHDGAILKSAAALFGETPARSILLRSEEFARACDLFLVVGTSMSTLPAAGLPDEAREAGARVAVVNRGPLAREVSPDLVVEADAAETLAALAA